MANLSKILVFPIKSLDPITLDEVAITSGGALTGDREFAIFDPSETMSRHAFYWWDKE